MIFSILSEQFGTPLHEIGHALGLLHEQSRPDRDNYLKILWNNIVPKYYSQYERYNWTMVQTHDIPYDLGSIMQYSASVRL